MSRGWWVLLLGLAIVAAPTEAVDTALDPFFGKAQNAGDELKPFFIVDTSGIWPKHNIEVCWEPSANSYTLEKSWVQSSAKTFIEANSDYRFGDTWGDCDGDQRARIRIQIQDAAPMTDVGYQQVTSMPIGVTISPTMMRLNFVFLNWGKLCASPEEHRKQCVSTIAVHEFLHALGAVHEQLYPNLETIDPKCWAIYESVADQHGKSPAPLTAYDPDSIMNYCRNIYSEPTRLSALDLIGLRALSMKTTEKMRNVAT